MKLCRRCSKNRGFLRDGCGSGPETTQQVGPSFKGNARGGELTHFAAMMLQRDNAPSASLAARKASSD